jgi:hypothetical protein
VLFFVVDVDGPEDEFMYSDDDDGSQQPLNEHMAAPLWFVDSIRELKPLEHDGWGGFGPLDQHLCVALAGVAPQLLSPIVDDDLARLDSERARALGCWSDAKWERDLGHMAGMVDNRTACFAACRMARLPYAGLQFGDECWCGLNYGLHEKHPDIGLFLLLFFFLFYPLTIHSHFNIECNMTCLSGETCGGPNRSLLFDIRHVL